MANIIQDKKEEAEILKNICMFIRPEAFSNESDFGITRSVSTEIEGEIKKRTGFSPEEVDIILKEDPKNLENFSTIERME